ncbi:MAG: capsule assembly Wzi family protein [Deltaproteobacteria bacterium]
MGDRDWIRVLSGRNIAGDLDTNQIAGVDARIHLCPLDRWVPLLKSLDLWGELYGEDQAGKFPSRNGYVLGMKLGEILLNGKTDFILEYASNVVQEHPGFWYTHHVYRNGYSYEGRIMEHDMGSEAREIPARREHYVTPDIVLGLNYNSQERGAWHPVQESQDRYNMDLGTGRLAPGSG